MLGLSWCVASFKHNTTQRASYALSRALSLDEAALSSARSVGNENTGSVTAGHRRQTQALLKALSRKRAKVTYSSSPAQDTNSQTWGSERRIGSITSITTLGSGGREGPCTGVGGVPAREGIMVPALTYLLWSGERGEGGYGILLHVP
jgi:hypothetical protein